MICLIAQPCNSDFFSLRKKCRREKNFSQFAYGNLRPLKKCRAKIGFSQFLLAKW